MQYLRGILLQNIRCYFWRLPALQHSCNDHFTGHPG